MNREIKFRALDQNGNWQYGTYYYGCMYPTSFNGHYVNDTNIDENTLGQFTGLKDGEKIDVYEGDVIGRVGFFNKVVVYHKNGFYTYSVNNPERLFPLSLD